MDNGIITSLIVAGTSLATLIVNNYVVIKNKRIDAEQKVNEHKLTIRAAYVNKKIEAGQKFVSRINVLIYNNYYKMSLTSEAIKTGKNNNELILIIDEIHKSLKDAYLKQDDATELFFDVSESNKKYDELSYELDSHGFKLSELELGSKEFVSEAKIVIECHKKVIDELLNGVTIVRKELKEYNIT